MRCCFLCCWAVQTRKLELSFELSSVTHWGRHLLWAADLLEIMSPTWRKRFLLVGFCSLVVATTFVNKVVCCFSFFKLLFIFLFRFSDLEILSPYRNPIRNRGVWTRVDILWVSHCSYVLIRQHVLSNLRFTYPTIFQRYVSLCSFTFLFPLLFGSVIKYNFFFF